MTKGIMTRDGYMTAVFRDGVEFGIYARTPQSLEKAFYSTTGGKLYFDPSKVDHIKIYKSKRQKAKDLEVA